MTDLSFVSKAKLHWTPERLSKLTGNKKLLMLPHEVPLLLRELGLLNKDASMSADAVRKFLQINHMLALLVSTLDDLADRFGTIGVADLCCGKSYLAFIIAHYLKYKRGKAFRLLGVDVRADVITTSNRMATSLGLQDEMRFNVGALDGKALDLSGAGFELAEGQNLPRIHLVVGLHACDTATDLVLATAINSECDAFAVAPCCQAELARKWSEAQIAKDFPFYSLFKTPQLRREAAAQHTDGMRLLLARSRGYKVTATEFVPSEHTNKNRLILGERKGRYLSEASEEYERLCTALGGQRISLDNLLPSPLT